MRYFLIKRKDVYKPRISLPYTVKEQIDISKGKIDFIDRVTIWQVKESDFTFFSDILTEPVFLLNERAREVLQIFDAKMEFKQIILFGQEKETVLLYYLPVLCEISGIQKEKNQIEISEKNAEILRRTPIVRLKIRENQSFLANMEIIESFLKRRLSGIDITMTDVVFREEALAV